LKIIFNATHYITDNDYQRQVLIENFSQLFFTWKKQSTSKEVLCCRRRE